jgi:hypothetical protein
LCFCAERQIYCLGNRVTIARQERGHANSYSKIALMRACDRAGMPAPHLVQNSADAPESGNRGASNCGLCTSLRFAGTCLPGTYERLLNLCAIQPTALNSCMLHQTPNPAAKKITLRVVGPSNSRNARIALTVSAESSAKRKAIKFIPRVPPLRVCLSRGALSSRHPGIPAALGGFERAVSHRIGNDDIRAARAHILMTFFIQAECHLASSADTAISF